MYAEFGYILARIRGKNLLYSSVCLKQFGINVEFFPGWITPKNVVVLKNNYEIHTLMVFLFRNEFADEHKSLQKAAPSPPGYSIVSHNNKADR
jgi:hypothetical protein